MFTHDAEEALTWGAELVNTMPGTLPGDGSPDTLTSVEDLAAFFAGRPWTGRFDRDEAELAAVRELRPQLRRYWESDESEVVALVNAMLAEAGAVPRLVDHDGIGWHIHATPLEAPLAERMAVEFAFAMVDVVRADGLDRLRVCEGEDCDDVIVDLSKNRSRRYCDGGCAARAHTAAYRARKAARA
ncbi:CGNR zinc finger domain-containing protein [Intrasporangium calvum]|uniref:CGNR zinc finger domain-containing protein n=1 Tax=Intrasporangium calvum TaxID=53358 RepID=A0ABT5GJ08_9MICO|nr:CGNR zinc finger domain-containing protein [Intrasporangium calvum]MDC5698234.1 CGNR zinc finger domain-containing protein [Intrasporangium calvum]